MNRYLVRNFKWIENLGKVPAKVFWQAHNFVPAKKQWLAGMVLKFRLYKYRLCPFDQDLGFPYCLNAYLDKIPEIAGTEFY